MGLSFEEISQRSGGDQKLVRRARISLTKVQDASYSEKEAYESGEIQETGERALGWMAPLDANGKFPCGFFSTTAHRPWAELGIHNYQNWVHKHRPQNLGATNLYDALVMGAEMAAEALKEPRILDLIAAEIPGDNKKGGLFGKFRKPQRLIGLDNDGKASYIIPPDKLAPIQTDRVFQLTIIADGGSNRGPRANNVAWDESPYNKPIGELVARLSYAGIFIKFIFVGQDKAGLEFLRFLDTMKVAKHPDDLADEGPSEPRAKDVEWFPGARYIDNINTVAFPQGIRVVTDEMFADAMTNELQTYVPGGLHHFWIGIRRFAMFF